MHGASSAEVMRREGAVPASPGKKSGRNKPGPRRLRRVWDGTGLPGFCKRVPETSTGASAAVCFIVRCAMKAGIDSHRRSITLTPFAFFTRAKEVIRPTAERQRGLSTQCQIGKQVWVVGFGFFSTFILFFTLERG